MLHGRGTERAAVGELVDAAGRGESGVLVLLGEAGAGKSALLDYAASLAGAPSLENAASLEDTASPEGTASGRPRVLRATGAEPEKELAFAALHQLLLPVTDLLGALPDPQRDAVGGALGLAAAPSADARFLVSAGVLSLLTEAAAEGGLLCVIDDFQWFDRASADAVAFAARRLRAEGVAILIALREDAGAVARDLPQARLGGLDKESAAELLAESAGKPISEPVQDQLIAATGGNPLALREAASLLTPGQLAGRAALPDPLPVGADLFGRQVADQPEETRLALLVAAAEGLGHLGVVLDAADRLAGARGTDGAPATGRTRGTDGAIGGGERGQGAAALTSAEAAGLVSVEGTTITFRHPLVRSAVYATAGSAQRRDAHAALADALAGDPDRRARHLAAAAAGPDEEVAAGLAAAAGRALGRGGYADAGAALARAAELTPDRDVRARRLADAAKACWLGGRPGQAETCLAAARDLTGDPRLLAELAQLRGRFELNGGDAAEALRVFADGAGRARDADPGRALQMLADAAEAAGNVGDDGAVIGIGRQAATYPGDTDPFMRAVLEGMGALLEGDAGRGVPLLRAALASAGGLDEAAPLLWASAAAGALGEIDASAGHIIQAGRVARISGMSGQLPVVLEYVARAERLSGRFGLSAAIAEEGLALAREAGYTNSVAAHLANLAVVAAVKGHQDDCERLAGESLAIAIPHRLGLHASVAAYATAFLELSLGRFATAHARFESMVRAGPGAGHPVSVGRTTPDRIEAALGAGETAAARSMLAAYERWSANAATAQAQALLERCHALVADDAVEAFARYEEAVRLHAAGKGGSPFEEARTSLLYGERLRRAHRGGDARAPLRLAMEAFQRLGADPWAARAHDELRAAGESAARPAPDALDELTPQELRIARLVGEGASSREVAARLFLSPRTVEYHLYKIYPKLGISSRTELARLLSA